MNEVEIYGNALLGYMGDIPWSPSSFERALFALFERCDQHNFTRLALAFPAAGQVAYAYRNGGPDAVKAILAAA